MDDKEFHTQIHDNVVDGLRTKGLTRFELPDINRAFLAMGRTDDLWEHTGVPMEKIREILVQAHNFLVIG